MASSSTLEDPTRPPCAAAPCRGAHHPGALSVVAPPASRFPALMLLLALTFGAYGLVAVDAGWPYLIGRLGTFIALPSALRVPGLPDRPPGGRASVATVGAAVVVTARAG